MRRLFLFLLSVLLASASLAFDCRFEQLNGGQNDPPFSVKVDWRLATGVTTEDRQAVALTLAETDSLLAGSVKGEGHLVIDLRPKIRGAELKHSQTGPIMRVGLQDVGIVAKPSSSTGWIGSTKHPRHARATWIHEYAHFYFNKMFETEFRRAVEKSADTMPESHKLFEEMAELTKRLNTVSAKADTLVEELESRPDKMDISTPRSKKLDTEIGVLLAEMDILLDAKSAITDKMFATKDPHVAQFSRLFAAFHEFYADTVANVQLGDMNAIRDNLYVAGGDPRNQASAESRGTRRSSKEWTMKDEHELMNESHVELARVAGPYLRNTKAKKQFLALVTKCLKGEMEAWMKRSYREINPGAINNGFIARLKLELKELGPPK